MWALRDLGTREVLEQALAFTTSDDPRVRARGIDILGQLGIPKRTFPEECLAAVIHSATSDSDPAVLHSAAFALGHLGDARGTPALVRLAEHDDVDVRHGVAFALGGRGDPEAIATLIRLTNDPEAFVRDWATFGLGVQSSVDTPEIRQALHRRLDDDDEQTRYEAICGLARCGDLRVVQPIIDGLTDEPDNFSLFPPAKTLLHMPDDSEGITAAALILRLRALAAS